MTTENNIAADNIANYRLYDRTGGGCTKDIYAASLEDAIQQGRDWIEAGDWEQGECEETLECEVGPIVYQSDSPKEIDEDATWAATRHDCSGTLTAKDAPECLDADSHDWRSPYSVVGGIQENPGVWGSGHGQVAIQDVCAYCGMYRTTDHGATNSTNGLRTTRTSYKPADAKSRAWLMQRLNLPEEIECKGVTVALDWDEGADITEDDAVLGYATHVVPEEDLNSGTADGPNDGETLEIEGVKFRLGQHDYETADGQVTCSAAIYRVLR